MPALKIAIRLETLKLDFRSALAAAARMGVQGVQFDAIGELSARNLSQTGCRQIRHLIGSYNLQLVGLGCPTRRGFDTLDQLEERIALTVKTLKLGQMLGARFIVNHIGELPDDPNADRNRHFWDALSRINREAERVGTLFAIHTGVDAPDALAQALDRIASFGLAVQYDPANLLARGHSEIYDGVRRLHQRIVGVYVKDVVRSGSSLAGYVEVPIGTGEIDWELLLGALDETDYRGFVTLAPESESTVETLTAAAGYLSGL